MHKGLNDLLVNNLRNLWPEHHTYLSNTCFILDITHCYQLQTEFVIRLPKIKHHYHVPCNNQGQWEWGATML